MKVTAIVPAAGRAKRMKKGSKKPFLILGDKPIVAHALSRLQDSPHINDIILVVDRRDIERGRRLVRKFGLTKVRKVISGGRTRFDSVRKGFRSINNKTDLVFIHDGARPFIKTSVISMAVKKAADFGAAVAAIPAVSTIKLVNKHKFIKSTPDRDKLWIAQTPQVFRYRLLSKAYKKTQRVRNKVFDDSLLAEQLGIKVKVVPDSEENIKITTPLDLVIAGTILKIRN